MKFPKFYQTKSVHFMLFFAFFGYSIFLKAQTPYTLQDCFAVVYKNNLALKSALIDQKIAAIQWSSSKSRLLPTIAASVSNNNQWGRSIDPETNSFINSKFLSLGGNLSSNLTLFSGFSKINAVKIAKHDTEISKAAYQKLKNDLTIEIASKYITILYLQENQKSNQAQLNTLMKQLELVNLKFSTGYIAENEVFKVKSQVANQEVSLINIKNQINANYDDLKQMLHIPLIDSIILNTIVTENPTILDLEQYKLQNMEKAIFSNPSYLITNLELQKAKINMAQSRAAFFPTLNANFGYGSNFSDSNTKYNLEQQLENNKNYGVYLSMSIPIFNRFQNSNNLKISQLNFQKAKLNTESSQNIVSKTVSQAINDTKSSKMKYEAAKVAFEFSKKSYEADNLKFELGKIDVNEITITKNIFAEAQSELIKSKYEFYFNNALIRFYYQNVFEF